jgi:hypothetical protein
VTTKSRDKRASTKLYFVAVVTFLVRFAQGSVADAVAGTYTTKFALTENPISESGSWINGKTTGLDWADVSTTDGMAIGLESGFTGYDDATALLTGTWGSNQTAMATVFTTNRMSGNVFEEVEIRLRSSLSPHNCTGYEVLFSLKQDSSAYVQIVRWNGPLGDFTYVAAIGGAQYVLHTDDTVKGSITNHTITAYINGTPVLQGTDTNFSSGNPGIGIFIQGATGVNGDYGFTSFTATDGQATPPPPNLTLFGPETNGVFTLRFNGIPGTSYRIQHTDNFNPANWQPLGTGTPDGFGQVQFTNNPPPGSAQRFYRSVWP